MKLKLRIRDLFIRNFYQLINDEIIKSIKLNKNKNHNYCVIVKPFRLPINEQKLNIALITIKI
jgi:hypothetical protein